MAIIPTGSEVLKMKRTHGLDEREVELVKHLMADWQTTGDIQAKLKKLLPVRLNRCSRLKWTNTSATRRTQLPVTTPETAGTGTVKRLYDIVNIPLHNSLKNFENIGHWNKYPWSGYSFQCNAPVAKPWLKNIYGAFRREGIHPIAEHIRRLFQ